MTAKLVTIAGALNARLMGEEGEVYLADGVVIPAPSPPLRERVVAFGSRLVANFKPTTPAPAPPFAVGDNVRDFLGRTAVVVAIDLRAEHGMGRIDIRYVDGRLASFAAIAHQLEIDKHNAD